MMNFINTNNFNRIGYNPYFAGAKSSDKTMVADNNQDTFVSNNVPQKDKKRTKTILAVIGGIILVVGGILLAKKIKNNKDITKEVKKSEEVLKKEAEDLKTKEIDAKYTENALKKIQTHGLEKIAGYEENKTALRENFLSPFIKSKTNPEVSVPNGLFLYGIHGMGKSTLARAIAEEALGSKIETNYHEVYSSNAETVVEELNKIKEKASKEFSGTKQRTLVFIDKFDTIAPEPGKPGYNSKTNEALKEFLDNCSDSGITVIAKVTPAQNVEQAIVDKFQGGIVIKPPTKQDIQGILKHYLEGVTDDTVKHEELAVAIDEKTKNGERYSCSAIEVITKQAKDIGSNAKRLVSQNDLLGVIKYKGPDISKMSLDEFLNGLNQ